VSGVDVRRGGIDPPRAGGDLRRLPALVLMALAAATTAAFFFVQHLKVTTPLLTGVSPPRPAVIDPLASRQCAGSSAQSSTFSFYLLHRADNVDVYVIDPSGARVATLASDRHMRRGLNIAPGRFAWNGRADNGSLARDGSYELQVTLVHQGRTIVLSPTDGAPPYTITVQRKAVNCRRPVSGG
jgi:hypothetical protein